MTCTSNHLPKYSKKFSPDPKQIIPKNKSDNNTKTTGI